MYEEIRVNVEADLAQRQAKLPGWQKAAESGEALAKLDLVDQERWIALLKRKLELIAAGINPDLAHHEAHMQSLGAEIDHLETKLSVPLPDDIDDLSKEWRKFDQLTLELYKQSFASIRTKIHVELERGTST